VAWAHQHQYRVIPIPGASAIQLALTASGFNGQQFTFHGYLPIQKEERSRMIRKMEQVLQQTGYTQIFMETPFRNNQLVESLLRESAASTHLCIAAGITGPREQIKTQTIGEWRKTPPDIHKIPAVFLFGRISAG
jgi:16S rRNA (cytidine1402-2'-O)-methyltransferase